MEIIANNNLIDTRYPVGTYISQNLPTIKAMAKILKEKYPKGEIVLWCRGSSGAIIAGIVASTSKRFTINHIKKENEECHSKEITLNNKITNVIIDDFIVSGETIQIIYDTIMRYKENINVNCLIVSGNVYKYSIKPLKLETLICLEYRTK